MIRLWYAFFYSIDGLKSAWQDEAAFRQEIYASLILIPLACYYAPDSLSFILMVGSLFLVMAFELLNTSVEAAIDRFGGEIHPLSKKAKDTASAAVLLSIIVSVLTWGVILGNVFL
jgi:diacylglycerol kinase (ATP)